MNTSYDLTMTNRHSKKRQKRRDAVAQMRRRTSERRDKRRLLDLMMLGVGKGWIVR